MFQCLYTLKWIDTKFIHYITDQENIKVHHINVKDMVQKAFEIDSIIKGFHIQ